MLSSPIVVSLAICAASAVAEGVLAGKRVKQYFATLRLPSYSEPLWMWSVIGVAYYAMCFFILYRLLGHGVDTTLRNVSLILILVLMTANAIWNFVFFRARNLFLSFVAFIPYLVVAVALFTCLTQFDKAAAWPLAAYLVYLLYAIRWGYLLWRINK